MINKLPAGTLARQMIFLANEIERCSERFSGFAHLALQDPVAAADELKRWLRDFGFCGAMILGHTNGQYLDDPALYPFWERAEALGALIYLHPADPVAPYPALSGYQALMRATWEWRIETGTHALRWVFGGVFDRFSAGKARARSPWAKRSRSYSGDLTRAKLYGVISPTVRQSTSGGTSLAPTSGMFSPEPLACTISALGHQRVMFAADYPFESPIEAGIYGQRFTR